MSIEIPKVDLPRYPDQKTILGLQRLFGDRKIFWDIDGTCKNSLDSVLECVKNDFGILIKPEEVIGFNGITEILLNRRSDLNLDYGQMNKYEWTYWTDSDVLSKAPDVAGAQFVMQMLDAAGFEQEIVTSRIPELAECTHALLGNFAPWVKKVSIRSDHTVDGSKFKAQTVGNNVLFDDSIDHVRATIESNPEAIAVYLAYKQDIGKFPHPRVIEINNSNGARNMWYTWRILKRLANVAHY
ncbi:MAG: hypothetical protein AAB546_02600 [Patescibacteria group bacterium]